MSLLMITHIWVMMTMSLNSGAKEAGLGQIDKEECKLQTCEAFGQRENS